ncbi:MAG: pilin [Patescibacteria group bacterium]
MRYLPTSIGLLAFPLLVAAQNPFLTVIEKTTAIVNAIVPLVITLALIYFIWGVAKYITAKDDEKKEEARNVMVYGVIGLFFIVSVWGIVALLQQFTGVQQQTTIPLPKVQ